MQWAKGALPAEVSDGVKIWALTFYTAEILQESPRIAPKEASVGGLMGKKWHSDRFSVSITVLFYEYDTTNIPQIFTHVPSKVNNFSSW